MIFRQTPEQSAAEVLAARCDLTAEQRESLQQSYAVRIQQEREGAAYRVKRHGYDAVADELGVEKSNR